MKTTNQENNVHTMNNTMRTGGPSFRNSSQDHRLEPGNLAGANHMDCSHGAHTSSQILANRGKPERAPVMQSSDREVCK